MGRWLFWPVLLGLLLGGGGARGGDAVTLILSDRGGAYAEAAAAFKAAYADQTPVRVLYADETSAEALSALSEEDGLLVPVGLSATRLVAARHAGGAAVLALMVPRAAYEAITWPNAMSRRKLSAVYIDQPTQRSLKLARLLFPTAQRIGMIYSSADPSMLTAMQQASERLSLRLVHAVVQAPAELASALRQVLPEADVFLLTPEASVVNTGNVQHVLLTTYRFRVPVVGFSQGLVKAGAVAAVYSTPEQIGRRGGQSANAWAQSGGGLPGPQYCGEYSVSINYHVARSLGLSLPDERSVLQQLGGGS